MTDFFWDLCSRCQSTGWVTERVSEMGGTGGNVETGFLVESRHCRACDGLGRVKVPTGYHLQPDAVGTVTVGSSTTVTAP